MVYLPRGGTCPVGCTCRGCTCPGVYLPGGTCLRVVPSWGGVPAQGGPCPGTPPRGQTDTYENIAFANFICGGNNNKAFQSKANCLFPKGDPCMQSGLGGAGLGLGVGVGSQVNKSKQVQVVVTWGPL